LRILLVGLGGGIGSIARYWLSGALERAVPATSFPLGTFVVNVAGCLVIGILAGLADARGLIGPDARAFLFAGLLGGFTTFSAFALETVNTLKAGSAAVAMTYVAASVVLGIGAAWLGRALVMQALR
jgi:CrcB protein